MGNQTPKSALKQEDSAERNREKAVIYEPHLHLPQTDTCSSPHPATNKTATWTLENVEHEATDPKVGEWRRISNSTSQHTGKPERQWLQGQRKGSSSNASKISTHTGSTQNVSETGSHTDSSSNVSENSPHTKPSSTSLTQNAVSNKGDSKQGSDDGSSLSRRKKILRPWLNFDTESNKGLKGPYSSLANQSLILNYSEPNLSARARMDNSDIYLVYTQRKKVSLTESNSEDSMSPEPRKNSIGGQSLSSEYATPAEDMSEITSPLDWSPNQDFMKLYWSNRESREESSSLQRKASENFIKVAGEIATLQREIQEALSEKDQIRTPPTEQPHSLRSASDLLRPGFKGYNTSSSSETVNMPNLDTRWTELVKSWQLRLKNIQGITDSGLKDLEASTLSQDKQQKTRFSWEQESGMTKKEDGTVDKKQYEMEVKRLQNLLSQQEEKTVNLEMVKNKEAQDLRREESRMKMELLLKESELKALREKMSSLQDAQEQANRKCKAQENQVLSLDKELEHSRMQQRVEKEKVASLEKTLWQERKDHKAEMDKVAALEQSLQQKLKEHRAEMQRALTLEQALEQERHIHRTEKERITSLEKALEKAQSEHKVQTETASSLKKTLEQTDSVQQARTERVLSLEKELEKTRGDLQAQLERASSLENLLTQLRSELKMQTETIAYLQKGERLSLDKESEMKQMQDLLKQLESEKAQLQKKLQDLQEKMQADADEWRQFQADLQTAVAVADDFKMEAEEQLQATREKLWDVEKENERLKVEVMQMKGTVTVDHGNYRERKEEAGNSLIDPPTVNGISRLRKILPAGPVTSSTRLNQANTETSGSLRTASSLNKSPRVTIQTAGNGNTLTSNGDRRPYPRNSVLQETTSNDIIKSREKGQDKPGSQVRRFAGSRRNSLLQWCQSRTVGYKNIEITNFSVCWSDGMAFCAVLHSYLPDRIPYSELIPTQKKDNLKLAFDTANSIGIPPSLTVEEMMDRDGPDWQSVLLYVESIYQHFEQ